MKFAQVQLLDHNPELIAVRVITPYLYFFDFESFDHQHRRNRDIRLVSAGKLDKVRLATSPFNEPLWYVWTDVPAP